MRWYASATRTVRLASATAVWHHSGLPPVAIRWALIADPDGTFEPQALLSANLEAPPTEIVARFVQRWQLEATFEEARALGHRNPAPVVGFGDSAHHATAVGAVLAGVFVRPSAAPRSGDAGAPGGLGCQGAANLQRRLGLCPPAPLAGHDFLDVA